MQCFISSRPGIVQVVFIASFYFLVLEQVPVPYVHVWMPKPFVSESPVPIYIKETCLNCLVIVNYWSHCQGNFVLVQAKQGRVYYRHFFSRRTSHCSIHPPLFFSHELPNRQLYIMSKTWIMVRVIQIFHLHADQHWQVELFPVRRGPILGLIPLCLQMLSHPKHFTCFE